ncbi:hypothetical protein HDV63DRAFT_398052 [Trichoderma sp. SZMC 28014]
MAHQGFGGVLDTPQSNLGDATYLSRQPDFADISQEASFQSPEKDGDLLQQLRNGRRSNGINIRTPRQRPALADRRNLPSNIGGGEFTPLLKSATRNSTQRNGKENSTTVAATPAALRKLLEEDEMTPLPRMDDNDFPPIASSASTTPMGPPPRRNILDKEQENVIDKIEKENFEALRKAGPGFIDKKDITTAEQQKHANKDQQAELNTLRETIQAREFDIEELRNKASRTEDHQERIETLENNDRIQTEREDELDDLKEKVNDLQDIIQARESEIEELQTQASHTQEHQERIDLLENNLTERENKLKDLKAFQQTAHDWEEKAEWMKERMNSALSQKEKAEAALDELQEEMANKSIMTKGLSRQIEEKLSRLQEELRKSSEEYTALELEATQVNQENDELKATVQEQLSLLEDAAHSQEEHQRYIEELIASEAALSKELEQEEIENLKYEMLQQQELINQQQLRAENMEIHLQEEVENITASETALREELEQEQQLRAEYDDALAEQRFIDDLQRRGKYDNTPAEVDTLKEKMLEQQRFIDDLLQREQQRIKPDRNVFQKQGLIDEMIASETLLRQELDRAQHQAEIESLREEDDVLQQQELIDDLMASEAALQQDLKRQQDLRTDSDTNTKAEIEALEQDVLQQQELIDEMRERQSLQRKQQSQAGSIRQGQRLQESQAEQELINNLVASEAVLRSKLERARTERAAYRMSKEAAAGAHKLSHRYGYADNEALDTIVRASEGAQVRHKKELRGMMLQMEWMQARWEREASLRSDAAYAKKFLQLQLNIAHACNKAQLRELEHIRTKVLQSRKPLTLPKPPSFSSSGGSSSPKLKTFLIMARFIARTRIAARNWAGQEAVRQKLRTAIEEKRQIKRSKQLKVVAADVY